MHLLNASNICNKKVKDSVLTIGNFDGVHRGHAAIFQHLRERSHSLGFPSLVVTFEPHPLKILAPQHAPKMITTFEQKAALIEAAGIDYLAVLDFTREFSQLEAEEFVQDILCGGFGMRHIVIGHDYAFGHGRRGNFDTFSHLGEKYGFGLEDIEPIGEENVIFSSSLARRLISDGDMPAAGAVLGRYHALSGRVVHGRDIGHTLGFPTANIVTRNELVPPDGIYAVMVALDGSLVQGACSIGTNPTFGGTERTIEVFLLDFSGTLYDRDIALCFVQRLRDVMKFPDVGALIEAIGRDVEATRSVLANVSSEMLEPLLLYESTYSP